MNPYELSSFFEAFALGKVRVLGFTQKDLIALHECMNRNDLSVEELCATVNAKSLRLGPIGFCQKQYMLKKVCTRHDGHDGPCE